MHRGLKHHGSWTRALVATAACATLTLLAAAPASAGDVPPGFEETEAFSGVSNPTVVRFAPDGTVYVAEKSGRIWTYDGLEDDSRTLFADLRTQVHNFWDRGLLGMELDVDYESSPFVYVLYTHNAAIGGTAPRWPAERRPHRLLPDPAGPDRRRLRRQRPALATGSRGRRHRARGRPGRGLVPAVSEPLGRLAGDGRLGRSLRDRRRRRFVQLRGLGSGREPGEPVRRPAHRRQPDAAERRGRGAAQPGRADDGVADHRSGGPRRDHDPGRSEHR